MSRNTSSLLVGTYFIVTILYIPMGFVLTIKIQSQKMSLKVHVTTHEEEKSGKKQRYPPTLIYEHETVQIQA